MRAFNWLYERVLIYDFLGIADWRELNHAFDFAAKEGYRQFLTDSIMRLGIQDDDYAEQGLAAKTLANWAQTRNVHSWIVNHLNKSDRSTKSRSRGSQQWIDNANNVLSVHRNEEKYAKIDELREDRKNNIISSDAELRDKLKDLEIKYDSYFDLHNQRWPGSRQNGRRYLYWSQALQLAEKPFEPAINWLGRWTPPPAEEPQEELAGTV